MDNNRGHCKIIQIGTLITGAVPDTKYLLEHINITARTWHAAIDPENTSLTISGEDPKYFYFTWQGWQYTFTALLKTISVLLLHVMFSLQNISPLIYYIDYIMPIGLISRKSQVPRYFGTIYVYWKVGDKLHKKCYSMVV